MKRSSNYYKYRGKRLYLMQRITGLTLAVLLFLIPCMTVLAADIESVIFQVADAYLTDYSAKSVIQSYDEADVMTYECQGYYAGAECGIMIAGPIAAEDMQIFIDHTGDYYQTTSKMNGCEIKEYSDGESVGVTVILNEYYIVAAIHSSNQMEFVKTMLQDAINGLASEGALNQEVPVIIEDPDSNSDTKAMSDVDGDPQAYPIEESLSEEALQDQDYPSGETDDSWIDDTAESSEQGIVGDLIDKSINIEEVQEEIRDTLNNAGELDNVFKHSHTTDTVAGVGSVGNIPGPSNATEAAVGVIVPGVIATTLSVIGSLGGAIPPTGGSPQSGMGGSPLLGGSPSTGTDSGSSYPSGAPATSSTVQTTVGQRKDDEYTDNLNMGNVTDTIGAQNTSGTGSGILIDTSSLEDNTGVEQQGAVPEEKNYNAEGFDAEGFDRNGFDRQGFDREGFNRYGFDREGYDVEGFNGKGYNKEGFDRSGFDENGFDKKGFDREGFDKNGFNENGFNREGFDKKGFDENGFDKEGFDKYGFDKEGFNREGFDKTGYDKEGFNREGFDKTGYDRDGFNREGFDREGFNQEGFDKAGYNKEGFDRNGYNKEGFDQAGYNKEGFDKEGFNQEGFNKEGLDREGFDKEGFDRQGFNKEGFDQEGYNKEGFNKEGLDREGFNQDGFDQEGFNRDGFNKEGFDRQGFDQEGFDKEGFDREGYNKEGFNQEGLDREGYDKKGYNNKGFDKEGFDQEGYNKEGYNKNGFNRDGYNQNGYDKNGYDKRGYDQKGYNKEGYNREGYDKNGYDKKGYDQDGYNKKGFTKDGYDKDGYDMEGFDYKGYNRSGYDPWGYDRQGYGKDGYHWSGYDADGYDRNGKHWSGYQKPTGEGAGITQGGIFDVDSSYDATASTPFTTATVKITASASTPKTNFDDDDVISSLMPEETVKPTEPPLGKPYPKTTEKYGLHKWTDDTKPETLPTDDITPSQPQNPAPSVDDIAPAQPQNPEPPVEDVMPSQPATQGPSDTFEYTDPNTGASTTYTYDPGYNGPRHGDMQILTGSTDGRTYEIEYNAVDGQWINKQTGNYFDPDRFDGWQADLAEDRRRSDEFFADAARRREAAEQARELREAEKKAGLEAVDRLQKVADRNFADQKGEVGDVISHLDNMKKDLENGEGFDAEQFGKIYRVMEGRVTGRSQKDTGDRHVETWADTMDYAKESAMATSREVMTGKKADGSTSWLGIGAKAAITVGAAVMTGGTSLAATATQKAAFFAVDGAMNVAEAMYVVKDSIDKGERGEVAFLRASGNFLLGEAKSYGIGEAGKAVIGQSMKHFPNFTSRTMDKVQTALLKGQAANIKLSGKVGLMSAKQTSKALDDINQELLKITGKSASGKVKVDTSDIAGSSSGRLKRTVGTDRDVNIESNIPGKTKVNLKGKVSGEPDVNLRGKTPGEPDVNVKGKTPGEPDVNAKGKAPTATEELGKDTTKSAPSNAQNNVKNNVENFDKLDPAKQKQLLDDQAMYDNYMAKAEQNVKDIERKVQSGEGLSRTDLNDMKADPASMRKLKPADKVAREEFNKVQDEILHQPVYKEVTDHLKGSYSEPLRARTVRTPGTNPGPACINTDNDVVVERFVNGEWQEIPKKEWEAVYNKSYAKHSGYSDAVAKERFPQTKWDELDETTKYKTWAEHHEETPMDRFNPMAANDFSDQRVYGTKQMVEATPEEIRSGVEYVVIDGKNMRNSTAFEMTKLGKGKLVDAEQLGMMEKYKFNEYWTKGANPAEVMHNQTEALEQLKKSCCAMKNLEQNYKNMGYKVADLPQNMQKAIDVVGNNKLAPSVRAQQLSKLGFDTPGDFADKVTSRIGALRIAKK